MKCPQCGQWNRASLPVCQKCGAPLEAPKASEAPQWLEQMQGSANRTYIRVDEDGEASSAPDARDALAQEMAELKKRKDEGARQQKRLRQESARRGAAPSSMTIRTHSSVDTFWSQVDTPVEDAREKRRRATGSRTEVHRGGQTDAAPDQPWEDSRTLDPLWTETASFDARTLAPRDPVFTGKLPSRARGMRRLVYALSLLLAGTLVGLCVFFGLNWFQTRQAVVAEQNRALVSASIKNNLAAHTILIPGEDGQQIYIREMHTSYIVSEGFATVEIEDHIWYDNIEDFVDERMQVTLTPFVKTASGRQKPLDLITYEIEVPLSPIQLVSPDGLRYEVVTAMYTMNFVVRPGSKVYINDKDVSDTVDSEDGSFAYNATVQPIGDNVFTIRVRSQYCRENSLTVTLYREPQEIPLDLAADTYTSTTLQKLTIKATTLPGATVDVLSPHSDLDITDLDATGEFSFIASFDKIGNNTVTITSSFPGKKTSVVNYVIYYIPNVNDYTRKAWPLAAAEYAELVSNTAFRAERNQVYVVMGKLDYLVSEKPQMGVFYTSDDGKSQPVLVENFTKTDWQVGTYYRIYADVYGTYNSMPWLCGRYTYTK